MIRLIFVIATLTALFAFPTTGRADRRIFGYTYPYQTLPKGMLELEHYLDLGLAGWDNPATPAVEESWSAPDWRHQLEFEYGISDHLDFGFYNVFRQKPYGTLKYEGLKVRSRYRFGEQGQRAIDPAIYLEVAYSGEAVKLEQMLILSKVLGKFEFTMNAKIEQEFGFKAKKWEYEALPLMGIGYHFNHHLALALEYYGKLKVEEGKVEYFVSYLGPAISVAGNQFFWTLALQPQLGDRVGLATIQLRSLFGAMF
jgi:hypothetical protein